MPPDPPLESCDRFGTSTHSFSALSWRRLREGLGVCVCPLNCRQPPILEAVALKLAIIQRADHQSPAGIGLSASRRQDVCQYSSYTTAMCYCGMMGKKNVPVWYSRGLRQGRTGQKDAREAGKTSGGPD